MKYNYRKTISLFLMIITGLIVISCAPLLNMSFLPPTTNNQISFDKLFEQYKQKQKVEILEKMKTKIPFTGDIDIKINTGLLSTDNNSRVYSIQSNQSTFDINALPAGAIIFQEKFFLNKNNLSLKRDFKILDTSKRYTLYLKTGNEVTGTINIGGFDWIRSSDFNEKQNSEILKDSILLNSNNSMVIDLKSNKSSEVTIMIIEGGQVGTFRKRKSTILDHTDNNSHIQTNDLNIFYPNENNFNGLKPNDGDITFSNLKLSSVLVNDEEMKFEPGVFMVQFNNSDGLELFQFLYGATVENFSGNTYTLRINLDKSPVNNIANLIYEYNKGLVEDIKKIEFSSLASLKTFTILFDFIINHHGVAKIIELNTPFKPTSDTNQMKPVINFKDSFTSYNDSSPENSTKAWWLEKTNVFNAWNYSIGTGVKVAEFESASGYSMAGDPEIDRRIILNDTYIKDADKCDTDAPAFSQEYIDHCVEMDLRYHGHNALMAAFAERNNFVFLTDKNFSKPFKSVGVAPNAEVMPLLTPYKKIYGPKLLDLVENNKVDIIGMNFELGIDPNFTENGTFDEFHDGVLITGNILYAMQHNVPVIISSGNHGGNIENFFPHLFFISDLGEESFPLIVVGSVNIDLSVRSSSNFGKNLIWAPGEKIAVANPCYKYLPEYKFYKEGIDINSKDSIACLSIGHNESETINFNDTSSAMPQVLAAVALIKSRAPNLTPSEIYKILRSTSKISLSNKTSFNQSECNLTKQSCQISSDILNDIHLIDIQAAVEMAIKQNKNGISDPLNSFYFAKWENPGTISEENSDLYLNNETGKIQLIKSINNDDWTKLKEKNVKFKLRGWRNKDVPKGKKYGNQELFEILDFEKFSLTVNSVETSLAGNNTKTPVSTSQTVGVEIPTELGLPLIENTTIKIAGKQTTIKSIVDQYVLFNVPPDIPEGVQDVIISIAGGGDITYKEALEIIAVVSKLKPAGPVSFPNGTTLQPDQFITSGQTEPVKVVKGGLYGLALNGDVNLNDISVFADGHRCTLLEVVQNYALYKIPPQVDTGIKNVIIEHAGGGSLTLEQALEVLVVSAGIIPNQSVTFPNGDSISPDKFVGNNFNTKLYPGDTVGFAFNTKVDINNISIMANGERCTLRSVVDNYVSFNISPNIDPGVVNLIIEYAGGGPITLEQALEILANGGPMNPDAINKVIMRGFSFPTDLLDIFDSETEQFGTLIQGSNSLSSLGWSPDKYKIVYALAGLGIYTMNPDGTGKELIYGTSDNVQDLKWSTNGQKIAGIIYIAGNRKLFTMNPDGSNYKDFSEEQSGINYNWARNSSKILFSTDRQQVSGLYMANPDGTNETKIIEDSNQTGISYPDILGNKIIYLLGNDIWSVDLDGSNPIKLTDYENTGIPVVEPKISPDGKKIAFKTPFHKIYTMNSNGTSLQDATENQFYYYSINFSWSPDSKRIVYSNDSNASSIYIVDADGTNRREISLGVKNYTPKWSTKNLKNPNIPLIQW